MYRKEVNTAIELSLIELRKMLEEKGYEFFTKKELMHIFSSRFAQDLRPSLSKKRVYAELLTAVRATYYSKSC